MVSKNNHYLNQQKSGRKFEKYSIKKLKVGAASVLVGAGFFFGYHVEASEVTATENVVNVKNTVLDDKKITIKPTGESTPNKEDIVTEKSVETGNAKVSTPVETEKAIETKPATPSVEEKKDETTTPQTPEVKPVVPLQTTKLQEKVTALETEINRIRSNEKQKSQIEKAEKLFEEAKLLISSNTATQKEVDAKAKEISSLTNILKSIKAEETPKINKNQDRRNGKMLRNGTGFRIGTEAARGATTSTTTGVGADVKDATETPAVKRPPYTDRKVAEGFAKQIAWLDFSDVGNWKNVAVENGTVVLKEGSEYEKEIMPDYRIKLKVKSLKPFQATEIYRKRMEAKNATPEEKATFNPNATNGIWNSNNPAKITATAQDQWSEIKNNGIDTLGKKTSIGSGDGANIGIQFEISGTYKGNTVRPAVVMADAESANPGENIVFTTNGKGWEQVIDLEKNGSNGHRYKPVNLYTKNYKTFPDVITGNADKLDGASIQNVGNGNKIAYKYFTNPDQETGGLGSGVFGPGVTAGKYSVPVVMTKGATEVGMYVFSTGSQKAMIGVAPIDEGDAPASYGEAVHTMNTKDGITGFDVKQPYLGSERPDMDTNNVKDWNGDDNTGTRDEGINQLLPDSLKGHEGDIIKANVSSKGYYTLNIQAHTGGAEKAYIRSWIDFNGNGKFDTDEASDIAEITQDGDVKLNFKNKTQKDAEGLLEAGTRVRIATNKVEIENPTGLAFSGEVEDFKAKITHPPYGEKKTTEGEIKQTQRDTVHFTARGKNIYEKEDVLAEIDTKVPPVYIDNKTGKEITLSAEGTYTVKGQGTYKFITNGADVNVEFTPADGFVGEAHGITIRRQDTNKTTTEWGANDSDSTLNVNDVTNTMDGLYIPKVRIPTVTPTPNNAESRNIQGLPQKGKPTFTVVTSDTPVTASAKHQAKLIDPTTNAVTDSTSVDALDPKNHKIGTYKIAPETGEVTFTPTDITYTGEVKPARVSVPVLIAHDKDDNDFTVDTEATYTPKITPVAPTAEAATTRDVQGKPQVSRIVLNTTEENVDRAKTVNFDRGSQTSNTGEHVELDNESLTLLDASGAETNTVTTDQGEYVLDKVSKTITFTPKKTFVGQATAVRVQIKDANGTKVETTYTPTVTDVTMTSEDKESSAPQGKTQTGTPTFTVSTPEVRITGYKLLNPTGNTPVEGNEIEVPDQGTYRINPTTGEVTFIPKPGFTGPATGITVQATDENGEIKDAKYKPTVTALTITPQPVTTTNIQGETQEGTPTFTIPAESNNVTVTSRKLVDPTDQTQTEKDSVTLAGKGTFTIDGNGKVTFVPVPTYKEDVPPITVKATVTITNAKNESTTITSTASYKPIIVPAEIDKAPATSTNLQGLVQTGTPTFTPKTIEVDGVQKTITVQPNSYKLVKDGKESESLPAYKVGTAEQIGTYTINSATGQVTFTPTDKTYTGAVQPVDVQATGSNGVKVQTTYTPTITPVTPTKEPSATTDVQGKKQVSRIVLDTVETDADKDKTVNFNKGSETGANGERVELDASTLTLLDGTNEVTSLTTSDGKYELDKANKTITFTPNKNFVGPATPVKVQIKDVNGTKVETTYTPTVTDVTMTSEDKESSAPQGKTQTGTPTFTVSTPEVRITGYKLLNPTGNTPVEGNEIEVPDQGTYRINPTTGEVTFIPKPGFTGPATGITVQATDENGETKDAKYKPTVTALTLTPQPATTTNIQGETQEGTPTFPVPAELNNVTVTNRKLVDPTDQTEKDSVKVEGKGTFTIDGNGKVTFTPLPTYKGDVDPITVKATVTITNDKNESKIISSTTTYKPIIISAEIDKEPATSTNLQGLTQTGTPTFKPKTVDVDGTPKTITVQPNSYKLVKDGAESNTLPAYKAGTTEQIGTYAINPATGVVTFTPTDKTYSGEVAPVSVQATGSNGVKVETTYTPIITPVTPTAEASATSDVQGKKQTSSIVLDTPENGADKDKTVNFNKGSQVGANGERVELDESTLTLLDGNNEVSTLTTNDGEYVLDKASKTITFTPKKTFVGTATAVRVQIKDANGTKVETTYTPTVTDITMKGDPATTSAPQGQTQTGKPTFTISSSEVSITGYKLLNPNGNTPVDGNEIEVPNEGTYRINPTTGQVTFIPKPGFTGPATGISVQATDGNGETAEAKYTPTVNAVTVTPVDKTTTNIQGVTQEETPTFTIPTESRNVTVTSRKLVDPADQTEKDSVTVAGKGTFTIDGNGKVTFTPEPTFKGEIDPITVKATVTVTNAKNESATITSTATYKPIIVAAEIDKAPATSTNLQGLVQTGTPTFTPKTVDVNGTPKEITVQPNSYKLVKGEAESESLPAYKAGTTVEIGTYTINSATGQVTFTPTDKTYTGAVEPVSVQATGSNGVKVQTTYTPEITPVTPTKEPSATTDVQGKKQVSRIVLDTVETGADKDQTVNFNKGTEQGPNREQVSLNPDTLTLLNDAGDEVSTLTTSDGEYVLDKANKTITFTPNKTFTGQAKAVKVQIKDANGTKVETTYTPTVTEVTPTGKDSATTGLQGFAQKSPIVFNQKDEEDGKTLNFDTGNEKVALKPDTLTLLNGNEKVKTITVPDVGTYELKDNAITFTPLPSYHGTPEGVTVQIEDENGKPVTKKYVPTVTQVTPTGTNTTSSGLQGKVQTGKPVFNGGVPEVPMNDEVPATLEGADQDGKVVIAGKGTYTVAKDGTVTFTPDKNFVGVAPAVTVKRVDKNGTIATATYTPTVTDVSMTSENKTSEALQGKTQTGTPTFTISTPDVRITEYKLVDPTNNTPVEEVEVENQGTYSIDKATGEVTFVPKPGFTGPTNGITVRATDENGETKDATYTPSVTPLKVTPDNKSTTNIQGLPQEATPTFKLPKGVTNAVVTERKLIDPSTKALTNSVIVDGKGTFTINANGKVTFTPVPSYVGDVPAIEVQGTITVLNDNNDSTTITSKASYKPIIVPIELEKTPAESTNVQGLVQKGTPTFTPQSVDVNGVEKSVTVKPNSYKLVKDGTETDTIPAYKKDTQEVIGKYTIDPQTGEVTFTPTDKTYTGEVEPATVQATGSNNVKVQTTYTPMIKPVKPIGTDAGSEGIQGAAQSGTPSFKSGNENIPMTVSATNPAKFFDPTTNQPIEATEIDAKNASGEKVGKYTINPATGEVTFTPEPGFSGTPVPATVQAKDGNGTPTTATYTPVVKAAVPSGDNQVTSDIQGAKQTVTPVFTPGKNTVNNQEVSVPFEAISKAKLIDPSKTGDEREVTTLVVENQGTYTIDDNGVVTFTPLPTFKGEATAVSIVRKDKNGTPATATFKPNVVGVTPSATPATTTKVQGATQETPVTFTPGKATIGTTEKSVPMDSASYKLLGGQEGKTPLDTVPAMSEDGTKEVGTYTIKVVEGKPVVTFTPTDKAYAGKLKPVTVQGKDTNGSEATTTYTPVIKPIVPTSENGTSEGPQGVEQTGSVTFKPGKEPGTENTPVAIDKTKMTLLGGTDGTTPVESLTVSKDGKVIGTYTLVKDPSGLPTGEVKFTPTDKSFVGEVPAATVQVKDANGTPVTGTYTPTFTEVNPTGADSATTGLQGLPQTSRVVLDEKDETDKTTVNFNAGHEKVTLKQDTLTLVNAAGDKVTTVTVPDVGTYELKDGVITFTPLKTFKGKTEGVTIQVEDANGKVVKQKYVPNVVEVLPTGKDTTSTGLQGQVQTGKPEFTPGSPEVPMDDESPATFEDGNITKTVDKVGTYTVAKDGTVTFTPNKDFSGEAPEVTVKRVDKNGTAVTAKYKPTVTKVTPTGKDTISTGLQGKVQTGTPVFTPGSPEVPMDDESPATFEDGNITKTIDKVGTYTVAKDGTVTFTPDKAFTGEAPEVTVKRVDKNGTSVTAKYKPTVTKVTPTGIDTTSTGLQGKVQTGKPVFTPGSPEVPMDDESPATFEDGNITKTVDKVGTYTVAKDGTVTFTPDKAFSGEAPEVTVKRIDKNGTSVTAKYKPTVTKVTPTGTDTTSTGLQGKVQTGTPVFTPGNPEVPMDDEVPATFEDGNITKTVDKVGTYTVAKDGTVTFTPDKAFSGEAPEVTVKRVDKNGTSVTAKYKPTVTKVTPTGKDTTSTGLQGKVQTGTPVFTPGAPEVPMDDEVPATFDNGQISKNVDKVGTYTVAKDGTVTFTPEKDFVGEAPEVTVKRVDKNGTAVTAKYKPIVAKVLPTGESSETEGAKGNPQTSAIVFDKKDEDKSTVNFNKGDETVALNPSTLTLVDKNGNPSIEVKVPGEGTYTLANNVITFTPEKDFAGKTTGVTVQVKDINGTSIEKTYTPTVRAVTTFVDPSGNPITVDKNNKPVESEVDGSKQPTKDIYGYKFVRTETDNKGNTKHIYEQAEGKSVKVTYVSTTGESLSDAQTVETKDKFIGTDYDASVESLKLERIEKDGKVYLLKERKADSATENGKLSDQEQTVTYVYEAVQEPASNQKYGNVIVVYKDKYGRPISGTTESGKEVSSTVIDTPNSPLTTKYDTTDHKPQTITTKDGKKYKLVKVLKSSDAEKSGVKARTSVITYVYELLDNTTEYPEAHIGLVLVNYLDEEGNPISGKTPEGKVVPNIVVDTEADLVGKDYDTTDHKVSTIIVENGDVYKLLKVSEKSVEKGKLTEGTTNVDYIYHKVVTKFVDENGKEIKSPEKGRTDKKDIPEYTFKETKKDENGNTVHVYTKKSSSTPVTPTPPTPSKEKDSLTIWKDGNGNNIKSPEKGKKEHSTIDGYIYERSEVDKDGNTVHIYRKVSSETPVVNDKETLFVDANGKPLQPAKKGQYPHETIPGYEFVRTETDANGNVRHVYRAIAQSQETVNPSPTVEQRKNELPNTGTGDELAIFGAAAASILTGLGMVVPGKKKEEEE